MKKILASAVLTLVMVSFSFADSGIIGKYGEPGKKAVTPMVEFTADKMYTLTKKGKRDDDGTLYKLENGVLQFCASPDVCMSFSQLMSQAMGGMAFDMNYVFKNGKLFVEQGGKSVELQKM